MRVFFVVVGVPCVLLFTFALGATQGNPFLAIITEEEYFFALGLSFVPLVLGVGTALWKHAFSPLLRGITLAFLIPLIWLSLVVVWRIYT